MQIAGIFKVLKNRELQIREIQNRELQGLPVDKEQSFMQGRRKLIKNGCIKLSISLLETLRTRDPRPCVDLHI